MEMDEIEATQTALRESIEATKVLARKADRLLQRHREMLEPAQSDDGGAAAPAWRDALRDRTLSA